MADVVPASLKKDVGVDPTGWSAVSAALHPVSALFLSKVSSSSSRHNPSLNYEVSSA